MEPKLDESQVLETETVEQKVARLEQEKGELESKNKQLFERVKKTEEKVVEAPLGNLQPKDAVLLAKSNVEAEDIDEIIAFADYRKISVGDALKNDTMQAILKDRVEKRKTAEATQINPPGRSQPRETAETVVELASRGQLPETDEGVERLAAARVEAKRNKKLGK